MLKLGERIKEIRKKHKKSQKIFAESIGVHPTTLIKYEKGRMIPGSDVLEQIIKIYKIEDLSWFLKGAPGGPKLPQILQPIIHSPEKFKNIIQEQAEHYRAIPLSEDGRLAAGDGGLAFDLNHPPESMVWVYEPEIGRSSHRLQALRVGGWSMEPTIPKNSIIVFDLDDKNFIDRKIYVIRRPEAGIDIAAIKRVRKGEKGFILISDNPVELPELIEGTDWNELVEGRAIWMWRSLLDA